MVIYFGCNSLLGKQAGSFLCGSCWSGRVGEWVSGCSFVLRVLPAAAAALAVRLRPAGLPNVVVVVVDVNPAHVFPSSASHRPLSSVSGCEPKTSTAESATTSRQVGSNQTKPPFFRHCSSTFHSRIVTVVNNFTLLNHPKKQRRRLTAYTTKATGDFNRDTAATFLWWYNPSFETIAISGPPRN